MTTPEHSCQPWVRTWRADPRLARLADRHYSRRTVGAAQFAPPGAFLGLITDCGLAGWVSWATDYADADWLRNAWCCSFFRNEGQAAYLSSDLVRSAVGATVAAWGIAPNGFVTTVDPARTRRKRDPGRCFRRAGFVELPERTKDRGLVILRLAPDRHPAPSPAAHTQMEMAA